MPLGKISDPLTCAQCGTKDQNAPFNGQSTHIGTSKKMRCPDCAVLESPYATLCRSCCPTGHGTHGDPMFAEEALNGSR